MPDPEAVAEMARAWYGRGDIDLGSARTLHEHRDETAAWIVCFHAQQAAEKHLKAALVAEQTPLPRTHELERLASLLTPSWEVPSPVALAALSGYAVAARYPQLSIDVDIEPTWTAAEEAITVAETVRQRVAAGLAARGTPLAASTAIPPSGLPHELEGDESG